MRGRAVECSLQRLNCHRMQGMRDTRMVRAEVRRLGREEGLSMDHRVRVAVMEGRQYGVDYRMITNALSPGWQLLYDRQWGAARTLMERTLPEASRGMLTHQVDQCRQIRRHATDQSF